MLSWFNSQSPWWWKAVCILGCIIFLLWAVSIIN